MDIERYEIRFAGSGGQGIILLSVVFAEAVGCHAGFQVCQTQSYGPEARGGKCKAEVVVSSSPIDYPKVTRPDLLLAMNQAACDAYFFNFRPNGLLVVDSTFVEQLPTSRAVALPFTGIARDRLGREMVANMVALGAVGHFCPLVSLEHLEKALVARVPAAHRQLNQEALAAGLEAARGVDTSRLPRSIAPEEEDEI